MYNLRARYYAPGQGRFLAQDTYPYNLGYPIELNRYAYAANSPINFSDPTGYTAFVDYAINVGKGAATGALIGGLSDAAIHLLTKPINEFSWQQVLQSTVAGAVSGAFGAMTGVLSGAKGLLGLTNTVILGMLDGWLAGLLSRGVMNWLSGNSFFDGYDIQALGTDLFTGGLMAGVFYGVGRALSNVVDSIPPVSAPSGCNIFSADTTVVTKEGDTPIHEIEIGDYVLAWNEETGELSFERVIDTVHHTDETVVHVTIDDEEIETTPEHPFYVEGKGWVNAEALQLLR